MKDANFLMLNIGLYRSHIVCIINFQTLHSISFISRFPSDQNICVWEQKKLNPMVPRAIAAGYSWQLPDSFQVSPDRPLSLSVCLAGARNGNVLPGPVLRLATNSWLPVGRRNRLQGKGGGKAQTQFPRISFLCLQETNISLWEY